MEYYVKSVISIIESNYHKLTSAEKTVADFFIHNNQNTDFSSSHIAELLYTSKATLSRFAKKIGYRGYQEFIYQYENTFEEKEEKITGNTKIVLNAYQEVLNKTYNLVDADTGYYNASEIKNCLDDGMTVLIKKAKANNSTKDYEFRKDKFKYDPEKDVYICPAEQQLYFFENTSKNGMKYK